MGSVMDYNTRLNITKCSFGMQVGKLLGFILTKRGIKANLDKSNTIIDMKNISIVKEVQQLTEHLVVLSHFLFCLGDKDLHLFTTLNKKENF